MSSGKAGYHDHQSVKRQQTLPTRDPGAQFEYTFHTFFHPFVGDLIARLNTKQLAGMLDAGWQDGLKASSLSPPTTQSGDSFDEAWKDSTRKDNVPPKYSNYFRDLYDPTEDDHDLVQVDYSPKKIDVSLDGPYANYNWELFFHIPITVAVHLTKVNRFAEAQRWFHYVFDPTSSDQSVELSKRFWKFLAFRKAGQGKNIADVVQLLSELPETLSPDDLKAQAAILNGYDKILDTPFQPHAVARTRLVAYQYYVVMKYLDNLIVWGDNLFHQDTTESINEATQLYVLAANILGERPRQVPALGKVLPKTFAQLKAAGLGKIGDTLVDLQAQFPLNIVALKSGSGGSGGSSALFGIGRTLYFGVPNNEKLLGYWDTVADRLFKLRHCMNIAGVVRPLALFDPPIDPGMLVKAAAAGIDIGSLINGQNQPIGPSRCIFLIQKAFELCAEVRNLGNALLSALEKGDAEHLALVRQRHEIQIQEMSQGVRFLQWKATQEATTSLLTSRSSALERLNYYRRLLGLPSDPNAPDTFTIDRSAKPDDPPKLTADNFDDVYGALVGQYSAPLTLQKLSDLQLAGDSSPGILSGFSGNGKVYLSKNEDTELNVHLPLARDAHLVAAAANVVASMLRPIPSLHIHGHFWGVGFSSDIISGETLSAVANAAGELGQIIGGWEQEQAGMTARYASYERRADEWLFQYNLAAHDVMQNGRQILSSLLSEEIARQEYLNTAQQHANAQEVDQLLHDKFTSEELCLWMQGEISRLYYEYYRFAFDTASRAETTTKRELMRPELDAQDFIKFNYWDGGRKGLLSGEALYLDLKRLEMAYHDNNRRELQLSKSVSLRQLDPLALLTLKWTGACQVTIPEWLYDLDCPGHYLRRLKTVSLSIPSVVGPYTSINCTLSLLSSSIRKSPVPKDGAYARSTDAEDERFVDYIGAVQSMVTSNAQDDSGMFETNLHDEQFLPFEGAGTVSTWKLELPKDYRAFDYATISDVILHVRYTARQGVDATKVKASLDDRFTQAPQSNLALLFNLRHEFPGEWAAFASGTGDFSAIIRRDYVPYFADKKKVTVEGIEIFGQDVSKHLPVQASMAALTTDLNDPLKRAFTVPVPADGVVLSRTADACLLVRYSLSNA